ncbi:MAG: response regulator [Elusimicrobia bacterium]|nr:response regulator [Elusimicrobiota bacterium]
MKKVLVVDDELDIVEVIKLSLEAEDFEVETAYSGKEGIEKFESFKPDVVILDILMEDVDGVTVRKRIGDSAKVIIISACDSKTKERIEKEIQFDRWLEKPFNVSDLVEEVKNIN